MEYVLLASLIGLTMLAFIMMKSDPLSPGFIMSAGFMFSAMCMCYNDANWDINTDPKTFFVVVVGVASFILANFLCELMYSKKIRRASNRNQCYYGTHDFKHNGVLHISNKVVILIFGYNCLVLVLYFIEVIRIAGFSSFTTMMYNFRQATGFEGASVSIVTNMLLRLTKAFSTVIIYYVVNNVVAGKSIRSQLYLLWPIIPDIMIGILTGGRFRFLQLILGPIIIYGMLVYVKTGKRVRVKAKLIFKIIIIALASLFLFYQIKALVGRQEQKDIITYVTEYFGGPIEIFDVVLRKSIPYIEPKVIGRNTFASIYRYLQKFLSFDPGPMGNPGFLLTRTGINIGNVYTCFFNYYVDFGVTGVVILCFLSGTIWSTLYYSCMTKYKNTSKMIYAYAFHGLLFQFYDEMTFRIFLSIDDWMAFVFIMFIAKHIIRRKHSTSKQIRTSENNVRIDTTVIAGPKGDI